MEKIYYREGHAHAGERDWVEIRTQRVGRTRRIESLASAKKIAWRHSRVRCRVAMRQAGLPDDLIIVAQRLDESTRWQGCYIPHAARDVHGWFELAATGGAVLELTGCGFE